MDKPQKSVTHGQCDARPAVTFPVAGHHRFLTDTKLYCSGLVTEAQVYEQLAPKNAQGRELTLSGKTVTESFLCLKTGITLGYFCACAVVL